MHFKCHVAAATLLLLAPLSARGQEGAERPSAMKLFPANTLVFVRSPNARELIDKLKESSLGRMASDPAVTPILGDFYSSANEAYEEHAAEHVGLSLDDLRELPQGEIAFGIVGRTGKTPAGLLLVDFGEQADKAKSAMEKLAAKAIEDGVDHAVEKIGDDDVHVWGPSDDEMVGIVQRDSVVLAANDRDVLARVLATWDRALVGESTTDPAHATLAENANFVSVIRECYREGEPPPQLVLFVDPINMIKSFVPGNPGLRIAVATFPALGIDGLLAIGGTYSIATENWDDLIHAHVLLDNPRAGVIRLFKFGPGKAEPPSYVPAGLETYAAIKIEPQLLFDEIAKLVDKFRHEGAFRELVAEGPDNALGISLEKDLLPHLTGQTHWMTGFDSSLAPGGKTVFVTEVTDPEAFRKVVDKIIEKYSDNFDERSFGGVTYHVLMPPWLRDLEEERRPFLPCVAIIGNAGLVSQSEAILQSMIEAEQGTKPRLADSIEYRLVSSQLGKLSRGFDPIWFSFRDNEATLEHWYGLLTSERAQEFLTREQEDETANRFSDVFRNNELPPFEVLAKYLAPTGSVAYDTDTGFHLIVISFRKE